jgi:hypothetical protein
MMAATILDPNNPAFDHVTVSIDGDKRVYTYMEFMALPLAERIQMILAGQPEFRHAGQLVEKKKALALG